MQCLRSRRLPAMSVRAGLNDARQRILFYKKDRITMTTALARKLDSIRDKADLKNFDVAQLLSTRVETVSRWKQGHAYPHRNTEKALLELEYVIDQLSDIYEPNEARQWLFSPQKLLDGLSPASLIQDGRIEEVRRLVNQVRDTVFM